LTPAVGFLIVFDKLVSLTTKESGDCLDIFCSGAWWKNLLNIQNTEIGGIQMVT